MLKAVVWRIWYFKYLLDKYPGEHPLALWHASRFWKKHTADLR